MSRVVLQVPMSNDLKRRALTEAERQGFSSLQEWVRLALMQLAQKRLKVSLGQVMPLTWRNEQRYLRMTEDLKKGKNWKVADSLEDFFAQLDEN